MFFCFGWPVENTGLDFRRPKGAEKSIFDTNDGHKDDVDDDDDDDGGDVIKKNRKERSKTLLFKIIYGVKFRC